MGFCWCYWGRPGVPGGDSVYKPKRHRLEGRAVECRKQIEEMQDKTDYYLRGKGKGKEPKEMKRTWSCVRPWIQAENRGLMPFFP